MSFARQIANFGVLTGATSLPVTQASFSFDRTREQPVLEIDGDVLLGTINTESIYDLNFSEPAGCVPDALLGIDLPENMSINPMVQPAETRTLDLLQDGGGEFVFHWNKRGPQTVELANTVSREATISLAPGRLGAKMTAVVDDNIAGVVASNSTKRLFSTLNHSTRTYVRNAEHWLGRTGAWPTMYSVGNTTQNQRAATLIAPNIGVTANHYAIANGATVYFVDADNNIETAVVESSFQVPATDIRLLKFSTELSSAIGFAKVFPKNWAEMFKSYLSFKIPFVYGDQERKLLVADVASINTAWQLSPPTDPTRLSFYETLVAGDSADPLMTYIDGSWVLFSTFLFSTAGPFITSFYDQINDWMATNSSYQLTDIEL